MPNDGYMRDFNVLEGTDSAPQPGMVQTDAFPQGGQGGPTQAGGILPRFFVDLRPAKPGATDAEGNPVTHIEVELVELLIAGDNKNAPQKKVTDAIRMQFRGHYEAWKRGRQIATSGSPIEMWPPLFGRAGLVELLKFNNVHTVEALAEIPDTGVQAIGMGALEIRKQAVAWLEEKRANDPLAKATVEVEELKAEGKRKDREISALVKRLEKLEADAAVDTRPVVNEEPAPDPKPKPKAAAPASA